MRSVQILVVCDECDTTIDEAEATLLQIEASGPGAGTYEMDLCYECQSSLLSTARFVRNKSKAKAAGSFACSHCDFVAKTAGGLSVHVARRHNPKE